MDTVADNKRQGDPVSTEVSTSSPSPPSTPRLGASAPSQLKMIEPRISMDGTKLTPLLPLTSAVSRELAKAKLAEEGTGVILIGLDNNEGTLTDKSTSESRRSSSFVDHRPSETNDTDHEDDDDVDGNHQIDVDKAPRRPASLISSSSESSSSESSERPTAIPVMLPDHRQRSPSLSSTSSLPHQNQQQQQQQQQTLRHRTSSTSIDSSTQQRTGRPRQPSSVNPPETIHSTITSQTTPTIAASQHSRRPSATEFQKFRDQLHQQQTTPITPTFPVVATTEEWHLHPNPHHPKTKTEILRIERTYTPVALPSKTRVSDITNYDVLIPRFSPAFPPILGDYGVSESEWTTFVGRVNKACMDAFDPFRWSNIVINIVNLLSFWMLEQILPNVTKRVLHPR